MVAAVPVTAGAATTVTITTPADGGRYAAGDAVLADYACSDDGAPVTPCDGPLASGDPIDTATTGAFDFTVTGGPDAVVETSSYEIVPRRCEADDATTGFQAPAEIALDCPAGATAVVKSGPEHGTVDIAGATATYTPDPAFAGGADAFTVVATENGVESDPVTIGVDMRPQACVSTTVDPVEYEGSAEIALDCPDAPEATIAVDDSGTTGTAELDGAVVTYTAGAGAHGDDGFSVIATIDGVDSDPATITVPVSPCRDVAFAAYSGWAAVVPVECPGDPDAAVAAATQPADGEGAVVESGGRLIYVSVAGWTGTTTFTYGPVGAAPATASATVAPLPGGAGGGGGGGGSSSGGTFVSGLLPEVPDDWSVPPGAGLPEIPFLPSMFTKGNDNYPRMGRRARVDVGKRAVRASRSGRVRLRLRNGNAFSVRVTLDARGLGSARSVRLSRPALTLGAGRSVAAVVRLDRDERALLRRLGRMRLRVKLLLRDPAGQTRTKRVKLTLRAPQP